METSKKQDQLRKIIRKFKVSDETNEIVVWDGFIDLFANGDKEIESKTYNLLKLMNEAKKSSEEEFKILMTRDIEEDLWFVI